MTGQLHPSAERVLAIIASFWSERGIPPTVLDVQKLAGFGSARTARYWLNELRDAGLVEWRKKPEPSLRLTPRGLEHLQLKEAR